MVRPRKAKGSYKIVPLNLDYDEFLEFEDSLPRSKSVSEEIRNYIKFKNEEHRTQKNVNSPNYSPINQCNNNIVSTLDKYFPSHIIEWNSFKNIIEKLENKDRKILTEIWLHDLKILELTNYRKTGSRVFPLLKGI